ncbi:MAG: alpha/beta hydrolase [Oculatellaceae cyanobacterium bins.114]|nr:alpha/beta hydrolase [Oculatellaceae cyanobacterium bins.114]
MNAIAETWQHDYLVTNGVRLHYVTQGEGSLMLMLHGFPDFWYSWRHQIPEFARDHKVVAVDLRGYNDSDKPAEKSAYTIPELVQDVVGIIRGLGYDRCILVGHDWGGAIAWNVAYTHPELIDRLIVLNLPHPTKFQQGLRTPQQLLRSSYIFFFQLPLLPEVVLRWNNYQAIATAFQGMAIDKSAFTADDLAAYKTAAAKPGALTSMLNYYRNLFQNGLKLSDRQWGKLKIPTLLIWGEKDIALGKELTYGTEAYVENLQICYIPDCSHWVHHEQPQRVNQTIREFLAT